MLQKKGLLLFMTGLVLMTLLLSAVMPAQAAGSGPRPRSNFLLRYLPRQFKVATNSAPAQNSTLAVSSPLASVNPTKIEGNPTCTGLGYLYGLKFDYPQDTPGAYPLGTGMVTWSVTDDKYVSWSSTFGVDAVIVKGGNNANLYEYQPPAESFGDTGLVSPVNQGGQVSKLSHVEFCYDYELEVSKTAVPTFTRTYAWTIDKTGDQTALKLAVGETYTVNYTVKVDSSYTDSDWAVAGVITITNPDPEFPAIITEVSDVVSDNIAATVNCGVNFPYTCLLYTSPSPRDS